MSEEKRETVSELQGVAQYPQYFKLPGEREREPSIDVYQTAGDF